MFSFIFNSKVYGPCKKKATNNHAEIQSAYIAIALARQLRVKKLCINTDSKVVFDAATDLIQKWEENDWKSLYDGRSIADRRYWEKLAFELEICKIQGMEIQFNLVEGHSGNEYHNEPITWLKKAQSFTVITKNYCWSTLITIKVTHKKKLRFTHLP